jgi:hypothetical protein
VSAGNAARTRRSVKSDRATPPSIIHGTEVAATDHEVASNKHAGVAHMHDEVGLADPTCLTATVRRRRSNVRIFPSC